MNDLTNWILEEGRNSDDLGAILKGLSERFVAQGNPLCWTALTMPTIDPTVAVLRFVWSRHKGLTSLAVSPEDSRGPEYQRSPIRYLAERNIRGERWKLEDPEVVKRFVLFEELRALGATEYAIRFVRFSKGNTALRGAVFSVATDRPGGFAGGEFEAVESILPALSLVAYRIGLSHVAEETLGAYLVRRPGRACCRA